LIKYTLGIFIAAARRCNDLWGRKILRPHYPSPGTPAEPEGFISWHPRAVAQFIEMQKETIHLRRALPADQEMLETWDRDLAVFNSDPDDEWDWEKELAYDPEWREQLVAMRGNRPIGFIQIIDPEREETQYWGPMGRGFRAIDIWIGSAADRGRGWGSIMMQLALQRCFDSPGVHTVLIDPLFTNTAAHRFYRRLGFEEVGRRQFDDSDCLVFRLERSRWKNTLGG
jgi:aminoglycoside 6'-N-acetyltransferase